MFLSKNGLKRFICFIVFVLLIIQYPFKFSYLNNTLYNLLYISFLSIFIIFISYEVLFNNLKIFFTKTDKIYFVFFIASFCYIIIFGFLFEEFIIKNEAQFLFRLIQYFLIVIIFNYINFENILNALYKLAIIFSLLTIALFLLNQIEIGIEPLRFQLLSGIEGDLYFYFPFGFYPGILPVPSIVFRSYSYFSEPAGFSFFLLIFYIHTFSSKKFSLVKTNLIRIVLFISILLTVSTAGIGLLILFTFFKMSFKFKFILTVIILFVSSIVIASLDDNQVLFRRLLSIQNRSSENQITISSIKNNPMGYGLGNTKSRGTILFLKEGELIKGLEREFTGPTNVLELIFAHGVLFSFLLFPLLILMIYYSYISNKLLNGNYFSWFILIVALVYCFSINLFLTPLMQIVIYGSSRTKKMQ